MLNLSQTIIDLLNPFGPVFCGETTWEKAKTLVVGAILRVMSLDKEARYAGHHHMLNRAVWSSLEASAVPLKLLLHHLDQGSAPLVFGIDETIEWRCGAKIAARSGCWGCGASTGTAVGRRSCIC